MQRKNFAKRSGVIVDVCGKHGVWLDADELEAVAGFIVQGGDPISKSNWRSPALGTGGPNYTLTAEISRKHVRGAVAAARKPDAMK